MIRGDDMGIIIPAPSARHFKSEDGTRATRTV